MAFIETALLRVTAAVAGLRARLAEERGQDLIEYAMLGGLIALTLAAAAVLLAMTGALQDMAAGIGACIDFDSATGCAPF